jgi:hypothetical protein
MSSFKEVVLKPIKYRFGFAVVIAISALAVALIAGGSIVAAIVTLAVIVAIGLALLRRPNGPADVDPSRPAWSSYSVSYRWKIDQKPNVVALSQLLIHDELLSDIESQTSNEIVLRGGSQLRTRLLGGYFVDPKRLPITVFLRSGSTGSREFTVELGISDKLGVAIRDEALRNRYAQAATDIRTVIEGKLDAMGGRKISTGAPANS